MPRMTNNYHANAYATIIDPDAENNDPTRKFEDPELGTGMLKHMETYFDPAHAREEYEKLFATTWVCAGRVTDLKDTGDWFRFDLGHESLIITRVSESEIKAYFNVCHHRGARLVTEDAGNGQRFVCGFHSWTWNINGKLERITDEETFDQDMICDRPGLTEVRVDVWAGFVFVTLNADAPPLDDFLDTLPEQLKAYRMQDMVLINDACVEWPVNWKMALDAFMEGYHIHRRHPEGVDWIEDYHLQHDFFGNGHSRMILPVPVKSPRVKDRNTLNEELRAMLSEVGLDPAEYEGRAEEVREALQQRKPLWAKEAGLDFSDYSPSQLTDDWNYFIFPNMTFNAHAEGVLVMRFLPHESDPEKCYYHIWVLAHRVKDPNYRMPRYMGAPEIDLSGEVPRPQRLKLQHGEVSLSQVLDQDADFVPRVQQGIKSRAFKGMRLSRQERRLRAFYEEYDRYMQGKTT